MKKLSKVLYSFAFLLYLLNYSAFLANPICDSIPFSKNYILSM